MKVCKNATEYRDIVFNAPYCKKCQIRGPYATEYTNGICWHEYNPTECPNFDKALTDSDLRISVAKLREVLENRIPPYSDPKYVVAEVDLIIEQVKKEL